MKKMLNDPQAYVEEMLEGLVLAHPQYYERAGDGRVIKRPGGPTPGKVGVVSGGGSGHLPIFTGYVGKGLLDACAIGEVFSSPPPIRWRKRCARPTAAPASCASMATTAATA
jgi:dihydroxyacetone kinase-like protein